MLTTSRRTRPLLAAAVAAVVATTGGAAWAVWRITGAQTGASAAQISADLRLVAHPSPAKPLYPGAKVTIEVTVHNDNPFPVLVNTVRPGSAPVTVDAAHRNAGCLTTGVSLTKAFYSVTWRIGANTEKSFFISNAVTMTNASDSACQGATFTVPLAASGRSDAS
ncbi:hypothetical protein FHR83_005006 [Actinoplanes campanulatus]|uniref:Uncharacterized protein n=1 Tax=Actinoplanes campanulatus TaxID=113559 RepID=A0A7W5FGA5_9ACTN|nr:hypothetical protein [Actinoplanes campanulatus]MBB3097331.1 hypothetical protein [Actinoplanes campanulatus]GGN17290.1 hypothetical protein GCM10010109_29900 [Actinoplanes campanulatus]GID37486.1 hypothetical protein Aca09nite_39920 [Actinoplanes campanulatus]